MRNLHKSSLRSATAFATLAAASVCVPTVAAAQDDPPSQWMDSSSADIVVTARRREETLMQAPVIASVIGGDDLIRANIVSVQALQEVMPTLRISTGLGGSVGSVVNIRGIGSGTSSVYIDQSVGIAIDQVGFSHGAFYDAAAFDLGQVEVLRGPQGLYFGKSTTAGIVSLTTANPTSTWQGAVTTGYEFNANELTLNGYVSGPIAENLGIRLAGFYRTLDGYLYNPNPAGSAAQRRIPDGHSEGGRLTLDYNSGGLRINLKGAITNSFSHGEQQAMRQFVSCPTGQAQNPFFRFDNCTLDKYVLGVTAFPAYDANIDWINSAGNTALFQQASPIPQSKSDGSGFIDKQSKLATLLVEYDFAPELTLTSVTGFGQVNTRTMQQGFIVNLGAYQLYSRWKSDDFSEELRLSTNWKDSLVNFMMGGLYTSSDNESYQPVVLPSLARFTNTLVNRKVKTKSAFGQVLVTPTEQIELVAGLRYTHVRQYIPLLTAVTNVVGNRPGDANDASVNQAAKFPRSSTNYTQDNLSPEFTFTYRPNSDLTAFASYKWGYKGPGYNISAFVSPIFPAPIPFGGEKVRGGELGVKASVLDRQMDLTVALYHYKYLGLQVSHYDGTRGISITSNGADATTKGVELGMNFRPRGIEGLSVETFVAYNDAKYNSFPTSPCYGGQTLATGCAPVSTTVATTIQDLSGERLQFAPRWTGNFNLAYTTRVADDYRLTLRGSLIASSRYNYTPANSPHGWQNGWATVDASVSLAGWNDQAEISLIGRNLTNKYYVVTGFDSGAVTPGVLSDLQAIANRSRQIMLQLTLRTGT